MTRSADHFDEFEPHSQLKQLLLGTYLDAWARALLLWGRAGNTVYYVDACAGSGQDKVGNPGSPVLAARKAIEIEKQLHEPPFNRDVRVAVIAIEKHAGRFKALEKNLVPFGLNASAVRGTAQDVLPTVLRQVGDAPALIFIDPFGMEPLKAELVYRALQRPFTEVFLLFADQAALRHYGVTSLDEEPSGEAQFELEIGMESPPELLGAHQARREQLQPTVESCEQIMNDAFGGTQWKDALRAAVPSQYRRALLDLYRKMLLRAGANFVLPIPIRRASNRHVYHLFHATRSAAGYVKMKEAWDHALQHGPVGGSAAETMRLLMRTDMQAIESRIRDVFAGTTIRWTDDGDRRNLGLKRLVLENTPALPSQLQELKRRLAPFRDRSSGRKEAYTFPPRQRG